MEKMEYLAKMFNVRTRGKDYENYVVNAIYNRVGNTELVPVTQQFVRSSKDARRYYLLDLYFPQLNYGIEVDERQHFQDDNKEADIIREQDIRDAISCEEGRIEIYQKVGYPKETIMRSFEDIEAQINREVQKIKEKIKKIEVKNNKLIWQTNEVLKKNVINRGVLSVKDDVDYNGITEIYNITGHTIKRLGRCFLSLNNYYYLWVPTMAIKLDNGVVKSSNNYENYLNENRDEIIEYDKTGSRFDLKDIEWDGKKQRVVFMKMRDRFGQPCIKFIGIFRTDGIDSDGGRHYKRVCESVNIADLK